MESKIYRPEANGLGASSKFLALNMTPIFLPDSYFNFRNSSVNGEQSPSINE